MQDYDTSNRTKFTHDEQITMLTLWCIIRSPLMIGGEMTGFDEFTMSLLTNERILAMHRTARHSHIVWRRVIDGNEFIVWTAQCADGGSYVALFNAGESVGTVEIPLAELEIPSPTDAVELWSGETSRLSKTLTAQIPPHGAKAYSC